MSARSVRHRFCQVSKSAELYSGMRSKTQIAQTKLCWAYEGMLRVDSVPDGACTNLIYKIGYAPGNREPTTGNIERALSKTRLAPLVSVAFVLAWACDVGAKISTRAAMSAAGRSPQSTYCSGEPVSLLCSHQKHGYREKDPHRRLWGSIFL